MAIRFIEYGPHVCFVEGPQKDLESEGIIPRGMKHPTNWRACSTFINFDRKGIIKITRLKLSNELRVWMNHAEAAQVNPTFRKFLNATLSKAKAPNFKFKAPEAIAQNGTGNAPAKAETTAAALELLQQMNTDQRQRWIARGRRIARN